MTRALSFSRIARVPLVILVISVTGEAFAEPILLSSLPIDFKISEEGFLDRPIIIDPPRPPIIFDPLAALQLYLEGAVYDVEKGTWSLQVPPTGAGEVKLRLWVIGNPNLGDRIWRFPWSPLLCDGFLDEPRLAEEVGLNPIYDVRLAIAYPAWLRTDTADLAVSFLPTTTGNLGGFVDPSVPTTPTFKQLGMEGTTPTIIGDFALPRHEVYGPGVVWQEFALGDFARLDSPIADFYLEFPTPTRTWGQINVYEVSLGHSAGLSLVGATFHFDVYGYQEAGGRQPWGLCWPPEPVAVWSMNHDAEVTVVPVPSTLGLLLSFVLSGGGWLAYRRVLSR